MYGWIGNLVFNYFLWCDCKGVIVNFVSFGVMLILL